MAESNLAIYLQVVEPTTDWNRVMIGNSHFTDDIWDLRVFLVASPIQESQKYIRFHHIKSIALKHTV